MIKNILTFFLLFKVIFGQDLTAYEVMDRVYSIPKPKTSIMEIRLEITRKKRDKEKTKVREFTRYEKYYEKGKYRSKSMARFNKPNVVKGTGEETTSSSNNMNAVLMIVFMVLFFGLAGWYSWAHFDAYDPPVASEHGELTDKLFWRTMWITGIVFVVTNILLFVFSL